MTKEVKLEGHHRDMAFGFVIIMLMLCVWNFFYAFLESLGIPIQSGLMTILAVLIVGKIVVMRVNPSVFTADGGAV